MQYKKVQIYIPLLLGFSLTCLQAQNILSVKEKSGMQISYALSDIKMLTFASGNINVNKKDGSISAYTLTNVCYLNFGKTTAKDEVLSDRISSLLLFPNPVVEQLGIQYTTVMSGKAHLQIMNVQGKMILEQSFDNQVGVNHITIPVARLQSGLYFCRLLTGSKSESSKFIKY